MLKWLIKLALGLLILAVVLGVIFLLSLDTLIRITVQHNLRQQTGMAAQIGKFHLGLLEPVVEIKDLRLYNSAEFGGTPFLTIPEIYVEYDRAALQKNQIHITLLRFNLGELDVVKGQDGQTNILSLGVQVPDQKTAAASSSRQMEELKRRTGMDFKGIDCLNVSVGKFKYLDLQDQKNDLEQNIGIDHCIVTNVTSGADLAGIGLLVGLRSGDFFKPLIAPGDAGAGGAGPEVLKLLGH
jgi:uncharacterized protein involved in outer membrane biogenesis